ncbi:MAG: helix-turn-helix domain-containing protein [Spirochaetaceae bacterium]|jgi:AraC-like DNA-binding protein/ligand-binding sensor protein|nr:helix-turn-helix domain-containing protein [Spirochaetaceae bacterium]
MKEKKEKNSVNASSRTDPILLKAYKMLTVYAKATGAMAWVLDHNYLPIAEMFKDSGVEGNVCLYCMKHRSGIEPESPQDFAGCPCAEMHINGIKESNRFRGSYIYMCELGFMFWTSPVYAEDRFVGALAGSGFLGIDPQEAAEQMHLMANGSVPMEAIREKLTGFPQGDSDRIKALSELMLILAESLSAGSEEYYKTMKRRAEQQSDLSVKIQELKEQYPAGTPLPDYPLDKERMLLSALRRGDNETGRRILNELLAVLLFANPDQFKYIQFRAIELVVLLSRTNVASGNTEKVLLETNNEYLKRIQKAQNVEELTDALHSIVERMAGQIFSFHGVRHASALRKAERFIWENYTRKISLQEIASASGLSAPYFSTIFKEEMGENLSSYLNRIRVEKASRMLTETDLSLSEIAGSCGFEDQSWFSKTFKHYIGVSPGKYRGQGGMAQEISEHNFSVACRRLIKEDE